MQTRRVKMVVNKAGSGSSTFRVTLPTSWIRQMGLGEDNRHLKLFFDGKQIIIKNNEEEIKMLEKLLSLAKVEIEKEMDRVGFIDDSDNTDRFLDELAKNLVEKELVPDGDLDLYYEKEAEIEELSEELLEIIKDNMNYDSVVVSNERGDKCYYKDLKGLVKWAGTWQDNSLQEAYQEFVDIYGIDITFEQFAEAYDVNPDDYLENNEEDE